MLGLFGEMVSCYTNLSKRISGKKRINAVLRIVSVYLSHFLHDLSLTSLDLRHSSLDLSLTSLDLSHFALDLSFTSVDLSHFALDLSHFTLDLSHFALDLRLTTVVLFGITTDQCYYDVNPGTIKKSVSDSVNKTFSKVSATDCRFFENQSQCPEKHPVQHPQKR
jgi:hypothetical protein